MSKQKRQKRQKRFGRPLTAYSRWLVRHYVIVWLGFALLLLTVGSGLRYLRVDVNAEQFFLTDDVHFLANQKFKEKYRIGENMGIYVESLSGPVRDLEHLSRLSQELERLPFVRSVRSLADLWQRSRGESPAERMGNLREFTARSPEWAALHSADWRELWLLIELYPYDSYAEKLGTGPLFPRHWEADFKPYLPKLLNGAGLVTEGDLRAALQKEGNIFPELLEGLLEHYEVSGNLRFIPVGVSVNSYRLEKELSRDLIKVLSLAALLCLLCILLLIPSRIAAGAAILCVLGNVILVFGLSGWLGWVADKTFVMIPVLLGFASSISYCVHLEKTWEKAWPKVSPKRGHIRSGILGQVLGQNLRPLSFAALTTVFSLLSFIVVPIPMIRTAGLQSAMAVCFSYLLSLSLFCSLLLFCRPRIPAAEGRTRKVLYRRVI
ncbi:MAG: hypothetical protein AAF975_04445, partial [Spirochaetota bacterium]